MLITNAKTLGDIGKYTEVVTCRAGAAITAKQNVMLDVSVGMVEHQTVIPDTGTAYFVGIALEAQATTGGDIRVAVAGFVDNAIGDGSVSAGEALMPKAGSVFDSYAAASVLPVVGVALEDDAPAMAVCLCGYGKGLLSL